MAASHRILVVEGDPLARLGLEYFLHREGFEARGSPTLEEALKGLDQIDIVFLEPDLPDGNGADLFKHIRNNNLPIRVAIMTAAAQSTVSALAGADAWFEKPITRQKLDAMLAWLKSLPPNALVP